jgi:hypothetical protein
LPLKPGGYQRLALRLAFEANNDAEASVTAVANYRTTLLCFLVDRADLGSRTKVGSRHAPNSFPRRCAGGRRWLSEMSG